MEKNLQPPPACLPPRLIFLAIARPNPFSRRSAPASKKKKKSRRQSLLLLISLARLPPCAQPSPFIAPSSPMVARAHSLCSPMADPSARPPTSPSSSRVPSPSLLGHGRCAELLLLLARMALLCSDRALAWSFLPAAAQPPGCLLAARFFLIPCAPASW
jgi:hypothetical protein